MYSIMDASYFKSINWKEIEQLCFEADKDELNKKICENIRKFRLERYYQFKELCSHVPSLNPYSTQRIAELLNYSHNYYKRFESKNDKTKNIPKDKLWLLSIILDKNLSDFYK